MPDWVYALSFWIEHHPGLAGWLQAAGAIIAIGVAIWIPARQRTNSRRDAELERSLKARGLLILIAPGLLEMRAEIDRAVASIDAAQPPDSGFTPQWWLIQQIPIHVPGLLREHVNELYLFGEPAGLSLLQLVSVTMQYEGMWATTEAMALSTRPPPLDGIRNACRNHIRIIDQVHKEAWDALRPFDIDRPQTDRPHKE